MKRETIYLYDPSGYSTGRGDFIPSINAYLHEDDNIRPAVIIAPGGGYEYVAAGEAYIIAMAYLKAGFQAYILTYTTNPFGAFEPIGMQPLKDASRAVCEVRKRSEEHKVDKNRVAMVGFSAGGHLTANLAVHHAHAGVKAGCDEGISNRPDAVVLSYPVVTSGEYTHQGSMSALYGNNLTAEQIDFLANEKNITAGSPPSFLWHTVSDNIVPVENSILFMQGCKKNNVPVELHIYPTGQHGLSAANQAWKDNEIGDSAYTYAQLLQDTIYLVNSKTYPVPQQLLDAKNMNVEQYAEAFYNMVKDMDRVNGLVYPTYDDRVSEWLELSIGFLKKTFSGLYNN